MDRILAAFNRFSSRTHTRHHTHTRTVLGEAAQTDWKAVAAAAAVVPLAQTTTAASTGDSMDSFPVTYSSQSRRRCLSLRFCVFATK